MSIGSSLSGITFSGLSSGIDTDNIISRLMQLEALPIQRLQQQQSLIKGKMDALGQLKSRLSSLSSSGGILNTDATYNTVSSSSSKSEVATVVTSSGALPGSYNLEVTKLAKAHKISSAAQSDTTTALGTTGKFVVNGKIINVISTDTMTSLAQKINDEVPGVAASLINGGTGSVYLTISADDTGASKKVQISDLTGNVAQSLGMINGTKAIREAITNGGTSYAFSSSTTALSTIMEGTTLGNRTFNINGTDITVNMDTASLQDIANAITVSGSGATASVRSVTTDGTTTYKLDITGTPLTMTDSGNLLASIGVLQAGYSTELIAAQDAQYKLDGISLTSAKNTISTAIPNATLTLLKANETTPETTTITVSSDIESVKGKVKQFADAYNAVADYIKAASAFDKDTFRTGPLFGDSTALQVDAQLSSMILNDVSGLSGTYKNLTSVGFSFSSEGKLNIDDAALTKAITDDPSAVKKLFMATGSTSVETLSYVSSTDKSKASGAGVFQVNITQLASQSYYTAETAQSSVSTQAETLTFSGTLFGTTPYNLILNIGNDVNASINQINNDSKLKDLVTASNSGGKLLITAKRYGVSSAFNVVSNLDAGTDNSGIGKTSAGVKATGVDVAGTINGETATGSGQFLTGNSGNANTDGVQVRYTGNTLGVIGSLTLTRGVGTQMQSLVGQYTDTVNGLLTSNDKELQAQIDLLSTNITEISNRMVLKEQDLRRKFAAMEQSISQLQQQQARLGAMFK